ncbi:MAG: chloride channel protein [Myxococcota bacterium]
MRSTLLRFLRDVDPMVPMVLVAAVVGVVSAFVVAAFKATLLALVHLYSRHDQLERAAAALPDWARILVPTVAATLAGLLMWAGRDWLRRRGPEYMEAVRVGDGHLPPGPNLVRTGASLLAVSGGLTIGREGAMIQLAAVVASALGRVWTEDVVQRRLVVASGVAAGFAGTYHAPIAGTLFVAEVILGSMRLREISAVLVAAVLGELTTQSLFVAGPLYQARGIANVAFSDLCDAVLLGLVAGIAGPAFLWLLDTARHRFQAAVRFVPLRMGLAGLVVGLLSTVSPDVWGNGHSSVQALLTLDWPVAALVTVALLRIVAVTAVSAAGIPGGVLTIILSLGGSLGLIVFHYLLVPSSDLSSDLWALVGMGSLLAAATHAPAMSAVMVFEIARDYDVVLAAMPACVVASVVANLLSRRTMYGEALAPDG